MNTIVLMIYRMAVKFMPETRCFGMKRWLLRRAGAKIGSNVRICSSVFIAGSGRLTIGDNTWVGHKVMLIVSGDLAIGSNVDIAPCVLITTGTHVPAPNSERMAGKGISIAVTVGDGTWVCTNATILPGVTIGNGCLVAAGSVVNKDINSNTMVAGVPAHIIKDYN